MESEIEERMVDVEDGESYSGNGEDIENIVSDEGIWMGRN